MVAPNPARMSSRDPSGDSFALLGPLGLGGGFMQVPSTVSSLCRQWRRMSEVMGGSAVPAAASSATLTCAAHSSGYLGQVMSLACAETLRC